MNTGMMVNLIGSLFQSFEMVRGLVQRPLWRSSTSKPNIADQATAGYLPPGALRRIRLSISE